MKNKLLRICPICKQPLPDYEHGNRKIHKQCENKAKHWNNFFGYKKIKDIRNTAITLDKVLETHFAHSTGKTPVDKKIFDDEEFKWDFNTRISKTNDGKPIFWLLDYGYSYVDSKQKQITIHYDN